jgi:hypothetical protein
MRVRFIREAAEIRGALIFPDDAREKSFFHWTNDTCRWRIELSVTPTNSRIAGAATRVPRLGPVSMLKDC